MCSDAWCVDAWCKPRSGHSSFSECIFQCRFKRVTLPLATTLLLAGLAPAFSTGQGHSSPTHCLLPLLSGCCRGEVALKLCIACRCVCLPVVQSVRKVFSNFGAPGHPGHRQILRKGFIYGVTSLVQLPGSSSWLRRTAACCRTRGRRFETGWKHP